MNIKVLLKLTAQALTAALLLPALLSCSGGGVGRDSSSAEDTTLPERGGIVLIEGGESRYSIKAGRYAQSLAADAITLLQKAIGTVWGVTLPIESDPAAPYIELRIEGEKKDWSITMDESNGCIGVVGGSAAALERAVRMLTSRLCAGSHVGDTLRIDASLSCSYIFERDKTDNSSLLSYIPTDRAVLTQTNASGSIMSPEWVESLIMVELRTEVASIGGKLADSLDLIDFYASIGVNGIWLTPIYEKGEGGNGYVNLGPHTVDPAYYSVSGAAPDGTTAADYSAGWAAVRQFVDYAHERGVYVFLDIITWGVNKNAPLIAEHPDWFAGESWGNVGFDWTNSELREWFISTCVDNILATGADGYRCDCEPGITGYSLFGEVRTRLAAAGKHIAVISEDGSDRSSAYDFEQDGVLKYSAMDRAQYYEQPVNFYVDGQLSIVDSVKTGEGLGGRACQADEAVRGTAKYYTNCLSNHDFLTRSVCGDLQKIGYAAILAPFIPLWYMGDEFNASHSAGVQYFQRVVYAEAELAPNALFLEDVRKLINIRRTRPEIFEYWPDDHRESNICAVEVAGLTSLQSYARYAGAAAVIVIANNDADCSCAGRVSIPFEAAGLSGHANYTVTDLLTGEVIAAGSAAEVDGFWAVVGYRQVGVYEVTVG